MNKNILFFWITALLMMSLVSRAQYFYFTVSDTAIEAIPGAGLDIKLLIDFEGSNPAPVKLSAETPKGIKAIFQPDSVLKSQNVILSVIVEDTNLRGQTRDIKLTASDGHQIISRWIHLNITDEIYIYSELAHIYRDSALHYLYSIYPDMLTKYGNLCNYKWDGFWPWPILLVVSNYNFLYEDWRINVLWHNMIYPHNWEKVFIFNESLGFCKGVKIDSIGNCSEINCEKKYYFQNNHPSGIDNITKNDVKILIYPVPANDYIYFSSLSQPTQKIRLVRLYDQIGNCILTTKIDDVTGTLNISMLPAGIYILRFDFEKFSIDKKLLVF